MKRFIHWSHVWLGVLSGLVLVLLCFSGSLAVFRIEISQWAAGGFPDGRTVCAIDADQALDTLRARLDSPSEIRRLSLPALTGGQLELRLANGRRAQSDICGTPILGARAEVADFLVNLHTRLFMGKAGRWIIGGIGVLMLLSLITGVLAHRKLLRQWFTLRLGRSHRLALSDAHKLLGVWLLPFHLLTAATGAWLGLSTLWTSGAVKGVQAEALAPYQRPAALAPMIVMAEQQLPGLQPVFVDFFPARGHVSVRGNLPGELVQRYSAEVLFDGHSGRVLGVHDPRTLTGATWWQQAMMPLHLGDWSGVSLRWLYAVLGLGSAGLIWLGLRLWADRRQHVAGVLLRRGPWAGYWVRAGTLAIALACVIPWLGWRASSQAYPVGATAFVIMLLGGLGAGLAWLRLSPRNTAAAKH